MPAASLRSWRSCEALSLLPVDTINHLLCTVSTKLRIARDQLPAAPPCGCGSSPVICTLRTTIHWVERQLARWVLVAQYYVAISVLTRLLARRVKRWKAQRLIRSDPGAILAQVFSCFPMANRNPHWYLPILIRWRALLSAQDLLETGSDNTVRAATWLLSFGAIVICKTGDNWVR